PTAGSGGRAGGRGRLSGPGRGRRPSSVPATVAVAGPSTQTTAVAYATVSGVRMGSLPPRAAAVGGEARVARGRGARQGQGEDVGGPGAHGDHAEVADVDGREVEQDEVL